MNILWIVFIVIAALIVLVLIIAATRPSAFRVSRTMSINASPEQIFPFINDFRSWARWSPYEVIDQTMKKTYSGAEQGVGAVYEWEGNAKAGKGRMEIKNTVVPSSIVIALDFDKPMKAHNTSEFTMVPSEGATSVTWAMSGNNGFMGKLMSVFMSMDNLVGKDFEKGLANLKTLAEK